MIHKVLLFNVAKISSHVYMFGFVEGIKNTVVRGAQDLLQQFFWSILSPLISMINSLLNALVNGILGVDVFSSNEFISGAFKCSLALMFAIMPVKMIWEIISAMIKDDDAGLDIRKKFGHMFWGIIIASSLTVAVTQIINPLMKQTTNALLQVNLSSEIKKDSNSSQLGDSLVESILISFGGLSKDGNYGANEFIKEYNNNDLKITERKDDTYVWDFSIFMSIIGMCVYVVMLFVVSIQIATRVIAIGFYYVVGPLACTSLTNYQNPQMYNVWKSSMIGAWAQNITQIFLLSLFVGLIDSISTAVSSIPIAMVIMYFAAFSLVLSAPNFVQAMIGGYGAGILDTLNQVRGGFGTAKSLISGAVGGTIGRSNPHTGHLEGGLRGKLLGDVNGQGNRVGGARGAVFGNPDSNGNRTGGIKGAVVGNEMNVGGVKGRQGGVRGAIFGNDKLSSDVNHGIQRERSGGLANIGGRKTTDNFNAQGQKTSSVKANALPAFRGSSRQMYNPHTGQPQGNPIHEQGSVASRINGLGNRINDSFGGGDDSTGSPPFNGPLGGGSVGGSMSGETSTYSASGTMNSSYMANVNSSQARGMGTGFRQNTVNTVGVSRSPQRPSHTPTNSVRTSNVSTSQTQQRNSGSITQQPRNRNNLGNRGGRK